PRRSNLSSSRVTRLSRVYVRAVSFIFSDATAAAPTGIRSARWALRPTAPNRVAASSARRPAVRVACLVVARALRVVAPAADRVRRADDFVADALRFAAFRFRVAAARLAAACRCDGDCVAIESVLLVSFFAPCVPTRPGSAQTAGPGGDRPAGGAILRPDDPVAVHLGA